MRIGKIIILAAAICSLWTAWGSLECGRIFQSDMVLPYGKEVPVWGTAAPQEAVTVSFKNKKYAATANAEGKWIVKLSPQKIDDQGTPLTVTSGKDTLTLDNILVGEVWLASGQSNMAFTMNEISDGKDKYQAENNTEIRLFSLKSKLHTQGGAYQPEDYGKWKNENTFDGSWKTTTPENIRSMSAAAYFFARGLQKELKIPIGIICNAVGGVGTEAWISPETLEKRPLYASFLGKEWLKSPLMSPWAVGRANQNLSQVLKSGETDLRHPFKPGFLFDEGIRWMAPFPISGVIWYQGETNAELDNKELNTSLITDLVSSWRDAFHNPKLPVYMIQLPRINDKSPLRAKWPEYREAQEEATRPLPHTGLVCTIDLGSKDSNVHPTLKKPVADRLVDAILAGVYGKKAPVSPSITKIKSKGKELFLATNAKNLRLSEGSTPAGFEIAGEDGRFVPAKAVLKGNVISLTADGIDHPKDVRYAWATYLEPNVVNESGLPLFPYRSLKSKKEIPALPLGKFPKNGKVKVACVGDSITFGYGIGKEETRYPQLLGRMLGEKFEVRNFGNSGKTAGEYPSQKHRKQWYGDNVEYTQAQEYQPDIIICNLGINDTGAWWDPSIFEAGYTTLVKTLKGSRNPTVLVWNKLGPDYRGAKGKKAYPGNVFDTHTFSAQDNKSSINRPEAERIINKIARQEKLYTLDAWTPLSNKPEWYAPDGLHPNDDGARKIAEITYDWLARPYKLPKRQTATP